MTTNGSLSNLFDQTQREQLELCAVLERIADSLPGDVDRQLCMQVARALGPVIHRAHETEEKHIFPALKKQGKIELDVAALVNQLSLDHVGDSFMAEEVVEVLMSYGTGNPLQDAEATGYILRGFFGGLRRHIALEQELFGAALAKYDAKSGANGLN